MSNQKVVSASSASPHSSAWITHTWLAFILSVSAIAGGVLFLPVQPWIKGYFGMGVLSTISSTINLSKTIRDVEESKRLVNRADEAKLERLLSEYDPYNKA
ncbi:MAG: YiaA/YiaB family inner membrane protein [Elainellaceae cyanobacterium]